MITPRYRHPAHPSGASHFHVECRVANHDRILGLDAGLAQRLKNHSGMRL